jgi:two-component system sensor histidine kinase BarA
MRMETPDPELSGPIAYDRALALHQVGGNPAIADELIGMMLAELPSQKAAMSVALQAADLQALRQVVHRIHGSASCCGTPAIKQASAALELAILQGELAQMPELHDKLQAAIDRLIALMGTTG